MALLSLTLQRFTPEHRSEMRPCLLPYTSKYCKQAIPCEEAGRLGIIGYVPSRRTSQQSGTNNAVSLSDRNDLCRSRRQPSALILYVLALDASPPRLPLYGPSNAGTVLWTVSKLCWWSLSPPRPTFRLSTAGEAFQCS